MRNPGESSLRYPMRRIFVEISNEKIDISGESTDIGDSRQSISCEYSGPDIRITFNSSLLHLPIKKIDSEFMKIMFRSESAALTISPEPDRCRTDEIQARSNT